MRGKKACCIKIRFYLRARRKGAIKMRKKPPDASEGVSGTLRHVKVAAMWMHASVFQRERRERGRIKSFGFVCVLDGCAAINIGMRYHTQRAGALSPGNLHACIFEWVREREQSLCVLDAASISRHAKHRQKTCTQLRVKMQKSKYLLLKNAKLLNQAVLSVDFIAEKKGILWKKLSNFQFFASVKNKSLVYVDQFQI